MSRRCSHARTACSRRIRAGRLVHEVTCLSCRRLLLKQVIWFA